LRCVYDIPDAGDSASSNNDRDLAAYEIRRKLAHPFDPAVGPPVVDSNVSSVNETYFGETAAKCVHVVRPGRSRDAVNRPYDRDWLRPARGRRPRRRRAAECGQQFPPSDGGVTGIIPRHECAVLNSSGTRGGRGDTPIPHNSGSAEQMFGEE